MNEIYRLNQLTSRQFLRLINDLGEILQHNKENHLRRITTKQPSKDLVNKIDNWLNN